MTDHDRDEQGTPDGADDPRARWRELPVRIDPETWVAEHDLDPVPGSVAAAEADREAREARGVLERGF